MACPTCGDWRGDDLCPACRRDGHEEAACGCVWTPGGTLVGCGGCYASGRVCAVCESARPMRDDRVCETCGAVSAEATA